MHPHPRWQLFLLHERCSPIMKTISQRIFGSRPAAAETIFSTDSYVDRLHSPKSAERNRRGCGEKFIVEGLNIHRPVDWKAFLTNDENKKSFMHLLLEHCDGPRYRLSGNHSEKILAENILRPGPGSRPSQD